LIGSLDSVVATIDEEGHFLYINDIAANQLGRKPADVIGKTMYDIFPPNVSEDQMRNVRKVIHENKGTTLENLSFVNGEFRWYRSMIEPIHDENGKVISALLNSTDIHDLKMAQENLLKLNETLEQRVKERTAEIQDLYDNSPTGYHTLDKEGTFQRMNATELKWIGYTSEEIIGKMKFSDLVVPDELEKFKREFSRFKQQGHVENLEFDLKRKDGTLLPVIITAAAIYDKNGNFAYSRSTMVDNTERKAIEAEIHRANNLSDTALELTRAGYWYAPLDGSGYFISSDRVIEIQGDPHHEDHRYHIENEWLINIKLANPELAALAGGAFNDVVTGKNNHFEAIYQYKRPLDGRIIWVHTLGNMVKDKNGKPVGISGVSQEITLQKQLESEIITAKESAEAANKAKSIFLANMSHEIRTPMNAILGFTQIILKDKLLDQKNRGYVEIINHSGEHLLTLINEILEMSKIEAGHITYNPTAFNLPALIQDIMNMFTPKIEAKNLTLELEIDPNIAEFIISDENKVKEILINILGNAVKFTQKGGITLRCRAERKPELKDPKDLVLYIDVEDTGDGISSEDMTKVFQAFEQTRSGAQMIGGTGLSLAISQSHANLLGGDITVTSTLGKGSCFQIKLIVQESERVEKEAEIPHRQVIGLKPGIPRPKILIVDDHVENRLVISELLEPLGFKTQSAEDGVQAVALSQNWAPDLILMDLRMPHMDGYQASKLIHASQGGAKIPIIALTASILEIDRQKVTDSGMDGYLQKPFKDYTLFSLLEEKLGKIFDYSSQIIETETIQQPKSSELTPDMIASIPLELIVELKSATIGANFDKIMDLIDQVSTFSPQIADKLRNLANNYQYDSLLQLFEKGGEHGD
jgi:PAS domain S-box-containing protein